MHEHTDTTTATIDLRDEWHPTAAEVERIVAELRPLIRRMAGESEHELASLALPVAA